MSIKIRKNGVIQDLVINANEVRVLDTEGNFRSKNLESVLKELNSSGGSGGGGMLKEAEYVFVSNTEPDYEGVWLDTSDGSTESGMSDNTVIEYIKNYIDNDVKAIVVENEQKVSQFSNPNLFINPDFKIWQRGERFEINTPSRSYTTDRWRCYNHPNTNSIVEKTEYGLKHTSTGEGVSCIEYVFEIPSYLKGRQVTISYELKSSKQIECLFYAFKNSDVTQVITNKKFKSDSQYSVVTHTFLVPTDVDIMTFWLDRTDSNRGDSITFDLKWAKLELGSCATPFIPKNYGEELALCQRYYQIIKNGIACPLAFFYDNNGVRMMDFFVPLVISMRTTPTFGVNNGATVNIKNFETGVTETGITTVGTLANVSSNATFVNVRFSKPNCTLKSGAFWVASGNGYLDAEIY